MEPKDAGAGRARSNVLKILLILVAGTVLLYVLGRSILILMSYAENELVNMGWIIMPNENASIAFENCVPGTEIYMKMGLVSGNMTAHGNTTWRGKIVCNSSGTIFYNGEMRNTTAYVINREEECLIVTSTSNASDSYEKCYGTGWEGYSNG
jgi:hypothetical protein